MTSDKFQLSNAAVYNILKNLMLVDGARVSYKDLDIEQIGSMYENLMGYEIGIANNPMVITSNGVPIDLQKILETNRKKRVDVIADLTNKKLSSEKILKLEQADTVDEIAALL